MESLKSKGTVRSSRQADGDYLVSFFNHQGYFRLSSAANQSELKEKIEKSLAEKKDIEFAYDRALTILSID